VDSWNFCSVLFAGNLIYNKGVWAERLLKWKVCFALESMNKKAQSAVSSKTVLIILSIMIWLQFTFDLEI
jgi:hypothetical protein